ncbi:MAG: IPT/TIG domain-containing protein [Candidatus Sulfotelmatobacter sp.]
MEGDCPDGSLPSAALVQDTDGSFYGTTETGGTSSACPSGCGTVFSLSVGLGPFVETLPASGAVGAAVKILGTDLTGATKVTFNGTEATFTVDSSSEISTTVPADAATGTLKVIDPRGTLSSNVPFRVTP